MKRRSQPRRARTRGTYGRKRAGGNMMYGPIPHSTVKAMQNTKTHG